MSNLADLKQAKIMDWLQVREEAEPGLFRLTFDTRHIGNPWIRSIHGGVTGSFMEVAAQMTVLKELPEGSTAYMSSNSTDYLRVTKDRDVFARAIITRISRRLAMVDVWCWQDDEDTPVTHATITLRIHKG